MQIPAAIGDFLRAHGDWDQAAALHRTALAAARQAGDLPGQALALRQLGILARQSGDLPAAAASLTQAVALYGEQATGPARLTPWTIWASFSSSAAITRLPWPAASWHWRLPSGPATSWPRPWPSLIWAMGNI